MPRNTKTAATNKVQKAAVKAKHRTANKFRDERKREALDQQLKKLQEQRAAPAPIMPTQQTNVHKTRSQTARDMDKTMEALDLLLK